MFSFLNRQSPKPDAAPDSTPPETDPARMSLAERMAYRREMLYQSIHESLQQLQVISSMYKFRVMNLDVRQHRFVAMIEVTHSFDPRMSGLTAGFSQVEAFIRKRVQARSDLSLEAIFWRVNEVESAFVHARRTWSEPGHEVPDEARPAGVRPPIGNTQPGPLGAISVQHLDYESDLTPLQVSDRTDGTQYGQL